MFSNTFFFFLYSYRIDNNNDAVCLGGSRHQTPDTTDERITDLPPRQFGSGRGPRIGGGRRDNRRDERRRTNDDEDTVLDSQDVSSVDRGKCILCIYEP